MVPDSVQPDAYFHPEAGTVYIRKHATYPINLPGSSGNPPHGKPFFCAGFFYATKEQAWNDFCARWDRADSDSDDQTLCDLIDQIKYDHACGYSD